MDIIDREKQKQAIGALVSETELKVNELKEELEKFKNRLAVLKDIQAELKEGEEV